MRDYTEFCKDCLVKRREERFPLHLCQEDTIYFPCFTHTMQQHQDLIFINYIISSTFPKKSVTPIFWPYSFLTHSFINLIIYLSIFFPLLRIYGRFSSLLYFYFNCIRARVMKFSCFSNDVIKHFIINFRIVVIYCIFIGRKQSNQQLCKVCLY